MHCCCYVGVGRYNCTAPATDGTFRSIPVDWLCDGENDCGNTAAEDETNCSSSKKLYLSK